MGPDCLLAVDYTTVYVVTVDTPCTGGCCNARASQAQLLALQDTPLCKGGCCRFRQERVIRGGNNKTMDEQKDINLMTRARPRGDTAD